MKTNEGADIDVSVVCENENHSTFNNTTQSVCPKPNCQYVTQRLGVSVLSSLEAVSSAFALDVRSDDLLLHCLDGSSFDPFKMDFDDSRKPVVNDPLVRAIGKRASNVIDATAGWCDDAANLVAHGLNVTAIEQNDVVMTMLAYAVKNAESSAIKTRLRLVHDNSLDYLNRLEEKVCVVFLDPMYPRKLKSSKPKKRIQILQRLVGEPVNEEALLTRALHCANQRVVVKRPHSAPSLTVKSSIENYDKAGGNKVGEVSTKLVRFDIYKPFET